MPTEPRPLMIRGDRLLLALDVLEFLAGHHEASCTCGAPHRVENPCGLSIEKTRAMLREHFPNLGGGRVADAAYRGGLMGLSERDAGLRALHRILRHATGIAATMFDAEATLAYSLQVWAHECERNEWNELVNFLRAIASGELTEADFRGE